MLLIPCPWCGPRDEAEFHYGAQADVPYPADPGSLTDEEWAAYLFTRTNPKGELHERWFHTAGCRQWLTVTRNTVTNEITATPPAPVNHADARAPAIPLPTPARAARQEPTGEKGAFFTPHPSAAGGVAGAGCEHTPDHPTAEPPADTARPAPEAAHRPPVQSRADDEGGAGGAPVTSAPAPGGGCRGTGGEGAGPARAALAVSFVFDGRAYQARDGEALASALLRNGVRVVGRSPGGRPRGVYGYGLGEPNAYVRVEGGDVMACATRLPVYDGLRASSLAG